MSIVSYISRRDIRALGDASSYTALAVMESLLVAHGGNTRRLPWRLMYPLYLRAKYAAHSTAHAILSQLPFIPHLSRACRACGRSTQRRVFDVLLCAKCTRNPNSHGWMVPARIAVSLQVYHIPYHSGPRGPLVLANHIQEFGRISRTRLFRTMNIVPCATRATQGYSWLL